MKIVFEPGQGFVRMKRSQKWHIIREDNYTPKSLCGKTFMYPVHEYLRQNSRPPIIEKCCLDIYLREEKEEN